MLKEREAKLEAQLEASDDEARRAALELAEAEKALQAVSLPARQVSVFHSLYTSMSFCPQFLSPKFANLRGKLPLCEPIGAKEMFHTFLLLDTGIS
jgi:hypothetical protein